MPPPPASGKNRISEYRKGLIAIGNTEFETLGNAEKQVTVLAQATIDSTGLVSNVSTAGIDLVLCSKEPPHTLQGQIKATKVWNAVWNDIADFQKLDDSLEFGKTYFDTASGAKICNQRCQQSVIGIASDTFGFGAGSGNPLYEGKEVPIAVAGWVLAEVDRNYEPGTPLTNDSAGNLTKMSFFEKLLWPERMVAIYKKKETASEFGVENKKIQVRGRHWVKVK